MLKRAIAVAMCVSILLLAVGCKSEDQIQNSVQQGNTQHEIIVKQEPMEPQNILKVSGSGEFVANPDIAKVSFAVVTQDKDAADAESINNETMQAVMDAVKAFGVADADLESSYFSMNPIYDYSSGKESITGYRVHNEICVTIRTLEKMGDILSAAMAAGANDVGSVSFSIEDTAIAYQNALKAAVADAASKAAILAESAGVRLDEVPYSIEETSYSTTPKYYEEFAVTEGAANDAADSSVSVPISRGELSVTAKVEVQFLIIGKMPKAEE